MGRDDDTTTPMKAVINDEEQYSIWPLDRENPRGWHDAGKEGPKADVLAWIDEVWTDMRPRSLRERMDGALTDGQGSASGRGPVSGQGHA